MARDEQAATDRGITDGDSPGRFSVYRIDDAPQWRRDLERPSRWTWRDIEYIEAIHDGILTVPDLSEKFGVTPGTTRNRIWRLLTITNSANMTELVWKVLKGQL